MYISPAVKPHLVPKKEFLEISRLLTREELVRTIQCNLQDKQRRNAAIVLEGKAGTGRTSLAIHVAVYCSPPNTCVHYFNQSVLCNKQFQSSILESPATPLNFTLRHPTVKPLHIVILDDIIDLKHFLEIKNLVHKLDAITGSCGGGGNASASTAKRKTAAASLTTTATTATQKEEKKKQILYIFIVDHPESRTLSARMQSLLTYFHLDEPTAEQCRSITNWKLGVHGAEVKEAAATYTNLSTLFASIRSQKQHSLTTIPSNWYLSHRVMDHEKEVVFSLLHEVFVERRRRAFSLQDQQTRIQNTDVRNVSLHYLENLPAALQTSLPDRRARRQLYLSTLQLFSDLDFAEFAAASNTQREMIKYLRISGALNLSIRAMITTTTTAAAKPRHQLPFASARDLEFTKLNTKYSMQQSEKWFMTLLGVRLGTFSVPNTTAECMQEHAQRLIAPLDSESPEVWAEFLEDHSFLHKKRHLLSLNDFRHLFRFLHMRIGAATSTAERLQLDREDWLRLTGNGTMLGEIPASSVLSSSLDLQQKKQKKANAAKLKAEAASSVSTLAATASSSSSKGKAKKRTWTSV